MTTLSLGAGFLVLGLSDFSTVRITGIATAATLFSALVANLFLLPALLELVGWQQLVDTPAPDVTGPDATAIPNVGL